MRDGPSIERGILCNVLCDVHGGDVRGIHSSKCLWGGIASDCRSFAIVRGWWVLGRDCSDELAWATHVSKKGWLMSSDQFSEKPLPQGKKRCPYCGEILKASDAACWLCLENVGVQEGWPEPSPSDRANLHRTHASSGESAALAIFGILAVLWIIGTAFEAPGMLLILLVLAVPALIRAAMSAQRGADDIERTPNFFLLFLNSLGVAG